MTVETFMPYALDGNLGAAYNRVMRRIGRDDWAIFLDHDVMLTTKVWYRQIVEAIGVVPEAGVIVAMANRIAPAWQQVECGMCRQIRQQRGRVLARAEKRPRHLHLPPPPVFSTRPCDNCHDIRHHRALGESRLAHRSLLDITDTKGWGGVLFALSKRAWRETGGFADGLLCVDHSMHFALQRTGRRSYLLESLYTYHWRRAWGDRLPKDTPIAKDCPCTFGDEMMPTDRVMLPCVSPS